MSLGAGTRLGPYEILAAIGAGGMGEVYRARDTRLDRTVAIKVLPAHIASDSDLRARFEREARAVAALNHPNICVLYDVGEALPTAASTLHTGDPTPDPPAPRPSSTSPIPSPIPIRYLVMEYLDGETLADRLTKGPLPLDQALTIAVQIASALDKAHRHGITHRDLKPGNVMLTKAGTARSGSPQAKLLDFGLAKLRPAATGAAAGVSAAPTMAAPFDFAQGMQGRPFDAAHGKPLTGKGTILGTVQYMAPEQLEGKDADAATDIFAFGAALYEMLTGKRAFEGTSQASLIAAILERDPPPISALQPLAPPALDRVVRKCLAKDPDQRWQTARDLGDELRWIAEDGSQADGLTPVVGHRRGLLSNARFAWSVAVALLVACVAALALGVVAYVRRAPADIRPVRFHISPPDTWLVRQNSGFGAAAPLAVSPDGQRIAFVAGNTAGINLLWVRSLEAFTAQALAGTDDASSPFWSPDGRFLGFFANGKLKRIDVAGGPPMTVCDLVAPGPRGGTWSPAGVIVFGQGTGVLYRVSASGGVPTAASTLRVDEAGHWRPSFLPDGRHFLYRVVQAPSRRAGPIYLASLDSTERTLLLNADSVNVAYAQNHLLFLRETALMAQPLDVGRPGLTGEAFPVAEQVLTQGAAASPLGVFSASENGVLAYQTGTSTTNSQLIWLDRSGKQIGVLGDEATYDDVELSQDGGHVAVSLAVPGQANQDIWLYDAARGLRTRVTFDPAVESDPIWSPDGSRIVFSSSRTGHADLYLEASNGAGAEEPLLADSLTKHPTSWSPDGRFILYAASGGAGTSSDLWVLPLSGDRKPFPFLRTPFSESSGQFSPDGHWIAYQSNESGRAEVYVAPFPAAGGKWMISAAGGSRPRWRHDGKEIFYLDSDDKLMAAAVVTNAKAGFEVGEVKPLFVTTRRQSAGYPYDVSANGERFLVNAIAVQAAAAPITVVLNWTAGLKKN